MRLNLPIVIHVGMKWGIIMITSRCVCEAEPAYSYSCRNEMGHNYDYIQVCL